MTDLPKAVSADYVARVNRAIDYITANLEQPLRLEDVARAACFSPYHFHRIFRGVLDETPASFVKRVRLERALYLLSHRENARLTDVALACGFSSSSDFSRSFREYYGVAPRVFDLATFRRLRRKEMEAATNTPGSEGSPAEEKSDRFVLRLRRLPMRRVAYIRVHRPYEGTGVVDAMRRLLAWAEARGFADGQWLGYQWEDPEIVPLEKCRYDVGLEVPRTTVGEGEVSMIDFAPFKVAEIDLAGSIELSLRAIDWLFRTWLPASGYAPAHQPMFEAWNGRPFAHGMEHFEFRIQLPVVDASMPF